MILNTILVGFVIITKVYGEARISVEEETIPYTARIVHSREKKNRDELARIIQFLNRNTKDGASLNYVEKSPKGRRVPKRISKYVEKSYDHYTKQSVPSVPEVRIHFIKNPEVIREFIENLRKGKTRYDSFLDDSSSSTSDDSNDRRPRADGPDIRRNAEFRTEDRGSNEGKYKNDDVAASPEFPVSLEDQVTPFQKHIIVQVDSKAPDDGKNESGNDDPKEETNRFKIKNHDDQATTDSFTAYSWKENQEEDNEELIVTGKGSRANKNVNSQEDEDRKKDMWDGVDKQREPKKGKYEKNRSDEDRHFRKEKKQTTQDWDVKSPRWDNEEDTKNSRDQTTSRKMEKISRQRKKKADKFDSLEEEDQIKKRNDYDERPRKKKTTQELFDEEPVRKKKVEDDWDRPLKDVVDNDWDKVGKDNHWTPKKEVIKDPKSYEENPSTQKSKNPWKSFKVDQSGRYDTGNSRPRNAARNKEYFRERGESNNYYKKERGGGSFFGRTPIPFIGRHGIYDENK